MNLIFTNQYFDGKDYVHPIKSYLDDRFYFPLLAAYTKLTNIFVKNQQISLEDDIVGLLSESKEDFFFQV